MRIEILGNPIPWKRARRCGNRYFDSQEKDKNLFREQIKKLVKLPDLAVSGLKVTLEYHMSIPKSYSRKKALKQEFKPHVGRPDLDNLIKFTLDTLNQEIWKDDCQIYHIEAKKIYSFIPKTIVEVYGF